MVTQRNPPTQRSGREPNWNPYWDAVIKLPSSDYMSRRGRWSPTGFGMRMDETGMPSYDNTLPTRTELVRQFAWAIPCQEALEWIALRAPAIVEIGAGKGYWAWQLSQLGVDVKCYDKAPPDVGPNHWHSPRTQAWHVYNQKDVERVKELWEPLNEAYEFWRSLPHSEKMGLLAPPPAPKIVLGEGEWVEAVDLDAKPVGVFHPVEYGDQEMARVCPERTLLLCWPPYGDRMAAEALEEYRAVGGQRVIYIGEWEGGCTADAGFFSLLEADWEQADVFPGHVQWDGIHDSIWMFDRKATW